MSDNNWITLSNPTRQINLALEDKAKTLADKLVSEAEKHEPEVTKDLIDITKGTPATVSYDQKDDAGVVHNSLDFRLKQRGSMANKLKEDSDFDVNKLGNKPIYDALRYTALVKNPEMLVKSYHAIMLNLEKRGYNIMRVKNTINNYTLARAYRGINTVIADKSGYKFELQFHTPQTLAVKEENHILYKKISSKNSAAENLKINEQMFKNSQKIKDIPGGGTIESFDKLGGNK